MPALSWIDVFVPADDFGLDGRQHVEVGGD